MKRLRILVVDSHPIFREGLANFVSMQSDMVCVGEADSIRTAHAEVEKDPPDLMVLDLWLKGGDGLELLKSLKARFPELRFLVLSHHDEMLYAERAIRAGANGYLMKEEATQTVIDGLRAIGLGRMTVSRRVEARMFQRFVNGGRQEESELLGNLSDRELHIFQMLGTGLAPRQIAAELNISPKTVSAHREHIKVKLDISGNRLLEMATLWVQRKPQSSPRL
jgi:DNA-binding NarL/FixJ family response regulator